MGKNLSNKYSQKLLDSPKKSAADAIKTASIRAIQKTGEATGDLIGNKIAHKIASVSKSPKELNSNELHLKTDKNETDRYTKRKTYISRKKTTNYWWIRIVMII